MIPPMLAIFMWPVVTYALFKRYSPAVALSCAMIGGALLLPPGRNLDLPMLPAISKYTMPSMAAFIISSIILKNSFNNKDMSAIRPGILPQNKLALLLLSGIFVGSILTVIFNGDRLVYGRTVVPGLTTYDVFSSILTSLIQILPLLLARKYLARAQDHKTLLTVLCFAGLAYSIPALLEVRISPKLNVLVYGFFPHDWHQHVRDGGYRPLVFLKHGLWLGIFFSAAIIATVACLRIATTNRWKYLVIAMWMIGTLVLSKTLGAVMITLGILPVVLFLGTRWQMLFAAGLAFIVLFYPMLRGAGLIPIQQVVEFTEGISAERAGSLKFRLRNEDILLEKANKRPVWGWGSWGRNRVFDENGNDISVTDGSWVIIIGSSGWIGYISRFGLFTLPIFILAFRKRRYDTTLATSGLCLVLISNLLDLIPNSSLQPMTWMLAGAIIGRLEIYSGEANDVDQIQSAPAGKVVRYSRSGPSAGRLAKMEDSTPAKPTASRASKYNRQYDEPNSN